MRLLLIDATSYLFRAFHAVGDLRNADGHPTGAMHGILTMLDKLLRTYPAERIGCVMDARGKTFRHEISPAYKAQRPPTAPELVQQIAPVKQFIRAMGLPLLCVEKVEADDVIATLARLGEAAGMEVIIASGDKDLMALVSERVLVYDSMREARHDTAGVMKKFAVSPPQMADYLALIGDSSDNIKGVEKVGAKTAAKWLAQYQSLDCIIANAAEIKGQVGEKLRLAIEDGTLHLARRLVALKDDVAEVNLEQCRPPAADSQQWRDLCEKYGFRQLSKLLETASPTAGNRAKIITITLADTLQLWVQHIEKNGVFAINTKTDEASMMQAEIVGFSLSCNDRAAAYIPLGHNESEQIPREETLSLVKPLLENPNITKIAHDAKQVCHVFANAGIVVRGIVEDVKIAAYIAAADDGTDLPSLATRLLGFDIARYRSVVDGKEIQKFSEAPIAAAADYAGQEAEATWKLKRAVVETLSDRAKGVYERIDRPLAPILLQMERAGVRIDAEELKTFAVDLRARKKVLEEEAFAQAGVSFNLNSPRQLEELLFDKLGAASGRKTRVGKHRSTDERTLEKLSDDFPLAKTALAHRTLSKLANTYVEKLPQTINARSGRVHTDFNQTAAVTGRLASSAPNLQNIPIRSEDGRRIRRAFIAADGMRLVSADYSQIELRLMAHVSRDRALLEAFSRKADVHRQTAAEVFSLDESSVSGEQRRHAKAINFGLIYGMSPFGLASNLGVSQARAEQYIARYFAHYAGVAAFMKKMRQTAEEADAVATIFGRRIPLSRQGNKPAVARAAINAPMQGGAADLIKLAMIAVSRWLQKEKMQSRLILQVHDELVLECPLAEVQAVCEKLPRLMCNVAELSVPLEVSINSGDNWDAAHA